MTSSTNTVVPISTELRSSLSKNAELLIDPQNSGFKTSMSRWSDEDPKTPAAIFKPATEEDIVKIVKTATQNRIPFVPKAGGNTPVSTSNETVTLQAGVLTKPLNVAVAKEGFVIQTPSGGAVSYIGFMLGVSARIVTATQGLVICSETENPDLFWGLKGAGQFFGIVTEVTMKIYRLEHPITSWTLIFLPGQIEKVAEVLDEVVNGCDARSPGMCAVMTPPGQTKPMLMVSITHFRPEAETEKMMAPLLLFPVMIRRQKCWFWSTIIPIESAEVARHPYRCRITWVYFFTIDGVRYTRANSRETYARSISIL
ncbi:uncharacterized protein PAC_15537 [Phialocephala subalpina]|uniref:FAD-binding PCMH-type domain-containing protein n=1 Tax=Phialocephala subalpina TaxID=576137 RepID=A0A1L7XL26_9HELO|nr:uncharacterized protein PAC_15537 [Phialocephala subalpina]